MEGFEEFDQYHSRSVKTLLITIQRRGNFSLNRAAYKSLGEPTAVKMLFHRSKRQIAFRKADASDLRSVPVRRQHQSESFLVAGLTFCKEYDIETGIARRYMGEIREGFLIVDLNGPSTDATGPRAYNEEGGGLQGKQERRIARRIAERTFTPGNEAQILQSSVTQESRSAATTRLSQDERISLQNALKNKDLSVQDILSLLGEVNDAQGQY